jgi:2'-5' RNA ligase
MIRAFIALELNQDQQRHLEKVIRQVALLVPSVRFVDSSSIHLTLAFLGELEDDRLAQVLEATQQVTQHCSPFSYCLDRIGIFGSPRFPRVIWMGVEEPTGVLHHLSRVLNQKLEQCGFETEKRPFSPHLTLARVKQPLVPVEQQRLQDLLTGKQANITSATSYPVHSLSVIKSELLPYGARYTLLRECPLKGI